MTITLIAIVLMTVWIPVFVYSQYKWKEKNYLFTKSFSAILFLTIGILGHLAKVAPENYSKSIIIALIFGLVGDVFLVFKKKNTKCFVFGLLSFLIGQIVYGLLFLRFGGFTPYDIILYAAIVSISLFVNSKVAFKFGRMKSPALFYMLSISFMYTMALSLIYKGVFSPLTTVAIAIGSTLFAISDMVLTFNMFKPDSPPSLKQVNLLLYFYGQMILAASIITFA